MIADVDDALRAMVRDRLTDEQVQIAFDAPTKDWAARRNAPTVDLYLYDIREDLTRRLAGLPDRRVDGQVVDRAPAPRSFRLSYLVTAWTARPEDEHRLLSAVLRCFLAADLIPADRLGGELADVDEPLRLTIGVPPPQDRSVSDIWSALGGELKPSLDVVVTAPLPFGEPVAAGPPVQHPLVVHLSDPATETVPDA